MTRQIKIPPCLILICLLHGSLVIAAKNGNVRGVIDILYRDTRRHNISIEDHGINNKVTVRRRILDKGFRNEVEWEHTDVNVSEERRKLSFWTSVMEFVHPHRDSASGGGGGGGNGSSGGGSSGSSGGGSSGSSGGGSSGSSGSGSSGSGSSSSGSSSGSSSSSSSSSGGSSSGGSNSNGDNSDWATESRSSWWQSSGSQATPAGSENGQNFSNQVPATRTFLAWMMLAVGAVAVASAAAFIVSRRRLRPVEEDGGHILNGAVLKRNSMFSSALDQKFNDANSDGSPTTDFVVA